MKLTVCCFCFFLFLFSNPLLSSQRGGLNPNAPSFVPASKSAPQEPADSISQRIKTKSKYSRGKVFCAFLVSEEEGRSLKSNPFICNTKNENGEPEVSFYALVPLHTLKAMMMEEEESWVGGCLAVDGFFLGRELSKKSVVWSVHLPDIVGKTILAIPETFDGDYYVLCCGYEGEKKDDLQIGITGGLEKGEASPYEAISREVFEETSLDLGKYSLVLALKGSHSQVGFVYRSSFQ